MKKPTIAEMMTSNERFDYSQVRLGRTDAIRRHCLDCQGYSFVGVDKCPDKKCPLWRYRLGTEINDHLNPKKELSEKQLEYIETLRNSD